MLEHQSRPLTAGRFTLELGRRPLLMGILNVTPDSFSDGGRHGSVDRAVAHTRAMLAEGADIIDVGGESTRPGAVEIGPTEELGRVMPVVSALRDIAAPVSIDTYKALVADQAVQAGASLINDVSGLQRDPEIADVAALYGVPVIAMHADRERDTGKDLIAEMARYFERSLAIADKAGVKREAVLLDPGFGFAKSLGENYEILRRLPELVALGFPVVVGTSRKSMIGRVTGAPSDQRAAGTAASSVLGYLGGGTVFRVHDVRANRDALRVAEAMLHGPDATA